jgi:hypothetical protein
METVRMRPCPPFATVVLVLAACSTGEPTVAAQASPVARAAQAAVPTTGMVKRRFPAEDPGIPIYMRLERSLDQVFRDGDWIVIPIYRDPTAIPPTFNLLTYFDPPGPGGPGAFAAPLRIEGHYMVEADAPLGTFPRIAISRGDAVPVWFVRREALAAAMADGVLTIGDLVALSPLRGTATRYAETLRPRVDEHLVVIDASGRLDDGRHFTVHVTHVGDRSQSVRIAFR